MLISTAIKVVALLSYLALALLTLRSKAEPGVRVLFSIYLFGMLFWQSTSLMVNFSTRAETALMWYNLIIAGSGTFNALFFPFSRAFLKIPRQKVLAFFAYLSCVLIFVGGVLGLPYQAAILGRSGYWVPVYDSVWLYILGPLGFFFWFCGIFNLVRGLSRERSPVQRNRITYVLLGACVVLLGVTTNLTGLRDYPIDISLNLVSAFLIGYAVVRYRLLDIRFILVRSLFYSVLTVALIAVYIGIVFGMESLLKASLGYSNPAYGIVATLVLALLFLPLRNLLQSGLDKVFFREKSDYQNVTRLFSRDITSLYETGEILSLVSGVLEQTMKVDTHSIALLDEEKQAYRIEKAHGSGSQAGEVICGAQSDLAQWLRRRGEVFVREEVELDPVARPLVEAHGELFRDSRISLVVPVISRNKLIGTLNLGQKLSGAMYNADDLGFLMTIANQTATAIEKSTVYREIQRRLSEQTLLFILSERFRGSTDFDSVMQSIVRILKSFLGCEYCALAYYERQGSSRIYASDQVSQTAGQVAAGAQSCLSAAIPEGRDVFSFEQEAIRDLVRGEPGLDGRTKDLLASFLYLPLARGEETFGVLILPNRTGVEPADQRELELLRTIRAIISQGIVLHRAIVNLLSVKNYNENILNSLNDMGDTLVILDLGGVIKNVNRATSALLGYAEEELVGQSFGMIAGEDGSPGGEKWLDRLIREESISNREITYRKRDGSPVPMLFSGSVMTGEDGKTREIVGIARDITEHIKAEEMAKNVLLVKEIHHRVKNNLQVISSLLYLQSGYLGDAKAREMFTESQNRVRSMALLHEKLYRSQSVSGLDFSEYIKDLTRNLLATYGVSTTWVDLTVSADGITLGMDTAVPCGLIINELVSNSLKHAFSNGGPGLITIEIVAAGEMDGVKRYRLVVSDNGKGFPRDLDFRATESLGLKLVCTLTEQLNGTIDLERNSGTRFTILFSES